VTDTKDITSQTEFDQATLVCMQRKAEYTTFLLRPLRTSELKGWIDRNVLKFCDCAATKCDVKFRIKGAVP
jgi:hypothetical protein